MLREALIYLLVVGDGSGHPTRDCIQEVSGRGQTAERVPCCVVSTQCGPVLARGRADTGASQNDADPGSSPTVEGSNGASLSLPH